VLNVEATLVAGDEREPAMLDLVPLAGDDDTNGLPVLHQAFAYDQQPASNYGLVSDGGPSQNPF
jgi:hypothetical protein